MGKSFLFGNLKYYALVSAISYGHIIYHMVKTAFINVNIKVLLIILLPLQNLKFRLYIDLYSTSTPLQTYYRVFPRFLIICLL